MVSSSQFRLLNSINEVRSKTTGDEETVECARVKSPIIKGIGCLAKRGINNSAAHK